MLVDIFGGDVNASVFPFEGISEGERLETVQFTEGCKNRVAVDDLGEVKGALFSVIKSDLQSVAGKIFSLSDF